MAAEYLLATSAASSRHPIVVQSVECGERTFNIRQQPANTATNGSKLWTSAQALLGWIEKNRLSFVGKRVLELGSGTGATGIAFLARGASVTLTDVSAVISLLQSNVDFNCTDEERKRARIAVYEWGTDCSALGGPFDIIVGTDIVYLRDLVAPLVKTLEALATEQTRIIFALEHRDPLVSEHLFALLTERGFDASKVKKSKMKDSDDKEFVDIYEIRRRRALAPGTDS